MTVAKPVTSYLITCAICGLQIVAEPKDWLHYHANMRDHVREAHENDTTNLAGETIVKGYAWTDREVFVSMITKDDMLVVKKIKEVFTAKP